MSQLKIRLVCATRESREGFLKNTALGRSWSLYASNTLLELLLFADNTRGLPAVYNEAITQAKDAPAVLVFIHDDVHLPDFYWPHRIVEGLKLFNIVGVAGNRRRADKQPAWAFVMGKDDKLVWDARENLSGLVGHGKGFPCSNLSFYGRVQQEVKLLDGVMLACHSSVLLENNIWFDESFLFHFYDLDFCRQAEIKNIKMGTCAVSIVHESGGNFASPAWRSAYAQYLAKWKN